MRGVRAAGPTSPVGRRRARASRDPGEGASFDLRKLDFVRQAREGISKLLESDNTYRAIAIHDDRMTEAVLCFDLTNATDLTLFAMAAFGELTGPRASDFHIALRMQFHFEGQALVWGRFAGKNNQQVTHAAAQTVA